jgi:hypothetical protein
VVIHSGDVGGDGEVPSSDSSWEAGRAARAARNIGKRAHGAGDASRQPWDVGVSPSGAGQAGRGPSSRGGAWRAEVGDGGVGGVGNCAGRSREAGGESSDRGVGSWCAGDTGGVGRVTVLPGGAAGEVGRVGCRGPRD